MSLLSEFCGASASRRRSSAPSRRRMRAWYSSLLISSMRRRRASPAGPLMAASSPGPYLAPRAFPPGPLGPRSVLGLEDLPAGASKERLQPGGAHARDNPVETLTVEIDDPDDVAETLDRLLGHRFPDVALVELRVPDERDKAVGGDGAEALTGVAS